MNPHLVVKTKYDPSATPYEINKIIIDSMPWDDRDGLNRQFNHYHEQRQHQEKAIQELTINIIPQQQRDYETKLDAVKQARKAAKKSELDNTAPKIDNAELSRLQSEWSMAASPLCRNKRKLEEAQQSVRDLLESIRIIGKFLGKPMQL